ncbi:MAG: right-handed parallel beta-helix repeat-containing protein [Burkholderiales bacterium]|nr:right-handed parallel beta-helix repeat-containing protein [Burkholderiales bacterium]
MAADFSRVRMDPLADFAGVELQQGRVLLDGDFNELVAVFDRRLRALASDVLGRATASQTTPAAFKLSPVAGGFTIARGRMYVDGLLAENHGRAVPAQRGFDPLLAETVYTQDPAYADQPWGTPPALPEAGRHLVYLDVWQRELSYIEDPALVEPALGVDTSSRLQTVWQVRVLGDEAPAGVDCGSPDGDVPGWAALTAPSSGRLTSGTFNVTAAPDPCELPPSGGYTGLENQLYRVEIHDPGLPGAGATFKWSRDNNSVASRVAAYVSATELELDSLGRDEVLRFKIGDWVEIKDDVREFAQAPGEMRKIADIDEGLRRIVFSPALPADMLPASFPDATLPGQRNLRVRRWDQAGKVYATGPGGTAVQVQDLDAAGSTGLVAVPAAGTTLLLENGVTVAFSDAGGPGLRSGDAWVFAARTNDASVEPLDQAPPRAVHHHYARLGFWDLAAGTISDCRGHWPPAGGGSDCGCSACVSAESHAAGTFTIQDAINRVRDAGGGTVCIAIGEYALREPLQLNGVKSMRIRGQGPGTVLVARGSAFVVQGAVALAIEDLAVLSVGADSAIAVRGALGLVLERLAVAVVSTDKAAAAALALAGVNLGVVLRESVLFAPLGIAGPEAVPATQDQTSFLLAAGLVAEDNLLLCARRAVSLEGPVLHLLETRLRGNQVNGCSDAAFVLLGLGLQGSDLRVADNRFAVSGQGVQCALEGVRIEGNEFDGSSAGAAAARAGTAAVDIVPGLARAGIASCRVAANRIAGFSRAAILVRVRVAELAIEANEVAACANGVLMTDGARAASVTVAENRLRDIGGSGASAVLAIGISRAEDAALSGNRMLRVAVQASAATARVGLQGLAIGRLSVQANQLAALAPPADYGGSAAGILVAGPYSDLSVGANKVARDAGSAGEPDRASWLALQVGPLASNSFTTGAGVFAQAHRAAYASLLPLPAGGGTLVISGLQAFVHGAAPAGSFTPAGTASVLGNRFAGRGVDPAVLVATAGECQFSDNRVEHGSSSGSAAVVLNCPLTVLSANRVRNNSDIAVQLNAGKLVAAVANITTGIIQVAGAPLGAPFDALNLRA